MDTFKQPNAHFKQIIYDKLMKRKDCSEALAFHVRLCQEDPLLVRQKVVVSPGSGSFISEILSLRQ